MVRQLPCTLCTVLFVPWWYNNSTLPRLHPLQCHSHLFCKLHIDHHFLPQTLLCSFLSLSASRSTPVSLSFLVSLSIVVLLFLLIVVLLLVISPWWIWWLLFSHCRCITTVLYAHAVRAACYGCFHAPAVQYPLYYAGRTIQRCPGRIHLVVTFVFFKSTHIDHFMLTFVSLFDSDSHYFLAFCSPLFLYTKDAINPHSSLLSAVRSKSPSSSWLYASVEPASCLEYKLYLVTCKRFSVHWVNQTTVSTPVWSVFWFTVRSDIDLQFTCSCMLNCCVHIRRCKMFSFNLHGETYP